MKLKNPTNTSEKPPVHDRVKHLFNSYLVQENVEEMLSDGSISLRYCKANPHLKKYYSEWDTETEKEKKDDRLLEALKMVKKYGLSQNRRGLDFYIVIVIERMKEFLEVINNINPESQFQFKIIDDKICFYEHGYQYQIIEDEQWGDFIINTVTPTCAVTRDKYITPQSQEKLSISVAKSFPIGKKTDIPLIAFSDYTYDGKSREKLPHSPDYNLTRMIDCSLNSAINISLMDWDERIMYLKENCPHWYHFFTTTLDHVNTPEEEKRWKKSCEIISKHYGVELCKPIEVFSIEEWGKELYLNNQTADDLDYDYADCQWAEWQLNAEKYFEAQKEKEYQLARQKELERAERENDIPF